MNDITIINPELPAPPLPEKRVWGGWATAGFGAVVLSAFFIVQSVAVIITLLPDIISLFKDLPGQGYSDYMNRLAEIFPHLGLAQSIATILSGIAGVGLIIVFIKLRRRAGIMEYLALPKITSKGVLQAIGIVVAYLVLSAGFNIWMGRTEGEQIMVDIYKTSVWPPLFWIAVIIFAPAFEEVFFRGFVFEGFRQSRMGAAGAIIITSVAWALLHALQYNLFDVGSILILGIVMGVVRLKTKSLWNTLIMHAMINLAATLELALNLDKYF
jgi:uncharacterized protein